MNIRLANIDDIQELNNLFKEVIKDMELKKINIWNDIYPFCEFDNDIYNKKMYIIEDEKEIVGSFVLNNDEDPDFEYIKWTLTDNKWISINRLTILPEKQGKGYAKEAMKFIEKYAIDNGYDIIKLTVYEKNYAAIGLYEKYKYKKVQEGSYMINNNVFIGYEKKIKER